MCPLEKETEIIAWRQEGAESFPGDGWTPRFQRCNFRPLICQFRGHPLRTQNVCAQQVLQYRCADGTPQYAAVYFPRILSVALLLVSLEGVFDQTLSGADMPEACHQNTAAFGLLLGTFPRPHTHTHTSGPPLGTPPVIHTKQLPMNASPASASSLYPCGLACYWWGLV